MSKPSKPTFRLTLEAFHRDDDQDGNRRLRSILKVLLRGYGFKALRVEWPPDAVWGKPDPVFDQEGRADG